MKKLVLLMTVAAIGMQAYAADGGYGARNHGGGERNGYAAREPEEQEQDFRGEQRRLPNAQQSAMFAELKQKARARELRQEQLRQRQQEQEEQEELRAQQQQKVMAQIRQNARIKAEREAEEQESRYAAREKDQDPRYAASTQRPPAELERERAIREEEMREEDELRATRADAYRRRILDDRTRHAEEEPVKKNVLQKAQALASKENIDTAKAVGSTISDLKGAWGGLFG
jgi:hypothetical protein